MNALFHEPSEPDSHALARLHALREEAMTLYERCLQTEEAAQFEAFLQAQLLAEPPPVQLFWEITDDLHQRLQTLRSQAYDETVDDSRALVLRQLHFTETLHGLVTDWTTAYSVSLARQHYGEYTYKRPNSTPSGAPFL